MLRSADRGSDPRASVRNCETGYFAWTYQPGIISLENPAGILHTGGEFTSLEK
jgi:hypothetical protein